MAKRVGFDGGDTKNTTQTRSDMVHLVPVPVHDCHAWTETPICSDGTGTTTSVGDE